MVPTLSLRRVRIKDLPRILEIEKQFYADAFTIDIFEDYEFESKMGLGFFEVLEVGGVIAGYAIAIDHLDGTYNIESIAIAPEFQGKQYSVYMVEVLENFIKRDSRAEAITLEVAETNTKARNLYEKFGYHYTDKKIERFYLDGTTALVMKKDLI